MRGMVRKELRALFGGLYGYLFLGLFWLFCGVFVTVFNFTYGSSALEYTMGFLIVAVGLVMPILTVKLFLFDGDEDRFLRLLPLSGKAIFFGKYLAATAAVGIATLSVAVLPLILDVFGDVHHPAAYSALLGFFLLAQALLAFQIFLATLFRGRLTAYLVGFLSMAALAGLQSLGAWLPDPFGGVISYLSVFGSFSPFVYGRLDGGRVLLYLSLSLVFLVLAWRQWNRRRGEEEKGALRVPVLVLALVLVAVNVGVAFVPSRFLRLDVSKSKNYTVSDSLGDYFASLEEDVTVWILENEGDDRKFVYFMEDLAASSPRLTLKKDGVKDCGDLLEKVGVKAEDLEGVPYGVILESRHRMEFVDYYSLFYYVNSNTSLISFFQTYFDAAEDGKLSWYEYQRYYYYLYQYSLQDSRYEEYLFYLVNDSALYFQGESVIAAATEYVAAERIPVKYALTGHGEAVMEGSVLEGLFSIYGESIQSLTLTEGGSIPADAASVWIAAPERDYTVGEIQALRDYLERGGTVTVLTDEANLSMPNLMALMADYGLSASAGAVKEEITVTEDDGQTFQTVVSDEVEAVANGQHDALAATGEETSLIPVITGGNAISFGASEDSSLILTALLSTSDQAIVGDNTAEKGVRVLAAAAENNRGARLCWFTGADSYTVALSGVSSSDAAISNNFCVYLTLDWTDLEYRSALTLPEDKPYQAAPLQATASAATVFGVFTILILPLFLVGIGIIVWYRRKKA